MAEPIGLRTRQQFACVTEKRDRWVALSNDPRAPERFEELVGPEWAGQNCALEEIRVPSLWERNPLGERRSVEFSHHVRAAHWLVQLSKSQEFLSVDDLQKIHFLMLEGLHPSAGRFRQCEMPSLGEGHEPAEAEMIRFVLENALEWFNSESFHEMHEVEKTALVLIKLIDIQPFEAANGRTLRLASNFFLLRAGYPPALIKAAKASQYAIAIEQALRFHTQPLIDLLTDSLLESLQYCLGEPFHPAKLPILQ